MNFSLPSFVEMVGQSISPPSMVVCWSALYAMVFRWSVRRTPVWSLLAPIGLASQSRTRLNALQVHRKTSSMCWVLDSLKLVHVV